MNMPSIPAGTRPGSPVAANIVTALIYLALGGLGVGLAVAHGFASPVFPAAGFAVAIILFAGKRSWPGIWIGAFALNLLIAWQGSHLGWSSVLLAAGIASGATLQALAARWLVLRGIGNGWRTLVRESDIVRCLLLAGPVASVISAGVGVSLLYAAERISLEQYLNTWWNWWCGDTLGVLVMLPLSLGWCLRGDPLWRKRSLPLAAVLLPMLGVMAAALLTLASWEQSQQKLHISAYGESIADLIESRLEKHMESLSDLRRLMEAVPDLRQEQFNFISRTALENSPDVLAYSSNRLVQLSQRSGFERQMGEKTARPDFEIKQQNSWRRLVRAADKPEYVVVEFGYPSAGKFSAAGYDLDSDTVAHAALLRARLSSKTVLSESFELMLKDRQHIGLLLLQPAHQHLLTAVERKGTDARPMGYAGTLLLADRMLELATRPARVESLLIQVDDEDSSGMARTLYRSDPATGEPESNLRWQKTLVMADRNWTLRVFPGSAYRPQTHQGSRMLFGAVAMVLLMLMQYILLSITGRNELANQLVAQKTSELRIQNAVLEMQTAELQAKHELIQKQASQFEALIAHSPDGLVAITAAGSIKFVNPAFQALTGIDKAEIVGKSVADLEAALQSAAESPAAFAGIAPAAGRDSEAASHPVLKLKNSRVLQLYDAQLSSYEIEHVVFMHDVTHEAEVARMKSEFLAHAAHELRTPMTSIYGFSELLLNVDMDDGTRRELVETIHRQTRWLVDIVNEMLDLARIEARGAQELQIGAVDLSALVRDTVTNHRFNADQRAVLDLPGEARQVETDPARLRQILTNLLSNASKYSPGHTEIRVALIEAPGKVGIAVQDQGIGMTPEQLRHFGERFWRADPSGATPGTGLGMAIVKEIIELLGGSLEVQSQPNLGTTVTLWIPLPASVHQTSVCQVLPDQQE